VRGILTWVLDNWLTLATAIVGILVSWYFYQRQKRPKTLDYYLASDQLISSKANPRKLKVHWAGGLPGHPENQHPEYELSDPRISRIHIRNTGKQEIEQNDFKQPITVSVSTGLIVDVEVTGTSHPGVYPLGTVNDPNVEERKWSFAPALLNPNDWVELTVLTDGASRPPKVSSWITGQSRSMGIWDPRRAPLYKVIIARLGSSTGRRILGALAILLAIGLIVGCVAWFYFETRDAMEEIVRRYGPLKPRPTTTPS
jgi:hypothetical protein